MTTNTKDVQMTSEILSEKEMMAMIGTVVTENTGWLLAVAASSSGASSSSSRTPDLQSLLGKLQESYDATSRLTLDVQQIGIQIMMDSGETAKAQQLAKCAVELAKELVPSSMLSADLLTRGALDRASIVANDVLKCLQDAAVPFMKLEKLFYSMVLEAVQNSACKKLRVQFKKQGQIVLA